ncbi:MAG: methyl-accepting chemotaxis protein, partial [Prosthecobacter sp.]
MPVPPTTHPGLARWTNLFSLLVIGIGGAAIAGWIFDVSLLKRLVPGGIAMKFNTALGFLLAGLSLRGAADCRSQGRRRLGQICAGLVILIGGLTLVEHISGLDLGLDNLLIKD